MLIISLNINDMFYIAISNFYRNNMVQTLCSLICHANHCLVRTLEFNKIPKSFDCNNIFLGFKWGVIQKLRHEETLDSSKKNNFSHRILLFILTLSFDVTSERHLIYCIIYAGFYTLLPILSYISCIFLLLSRCVMTPG